MSNRLTFIYCLLLLVPFPSVGDELEVGRKIYEQGILPNGQSLMGVGAGETTLAGQEAACSNCHRASGMGGVEGKTLMPPISADFLFNPEKHALAVTDPSHPMGLTLSDNAYSNSSLINAISNGISYKGMSLNMIMPRYQLDDESMKSLVSYLHNLSSTPSTGVVVDEEHFATVFTPEVDEKTKQVVKSEIEAFVIQHNANLNPSRRHRRFSFDRLRNTNYFWRFHFWELKGESSTWASQLDTFNKQQPVFALVSGISYQAADPVQEFCEKSKTPCLFRSVLYPPDKAGNYSLYYSKGMGLDSALFATGLKNGSIKKPTHVLQLMPSDESGERIATDLGHRLKALDILQDAIVLSTKNLPLIRQKLKALKPDELLVCWCDQSDLYRLGKVHIPKDSRLYFSGSLMMMKSGLKQFPAAWKDARLIYPYEEAVKRQRQLSSFYTWVAGHKFEPINEVLQSDAYLSMIILQEGMAQMVNNLYKDYLIERLEGVFGMSYDFWGMYSRPSLGPMQRYANRSGYIAKFEKKHWVPETERIVEE